MHYRLYSVGADGHFVGAINIEAGDDDEASKKAQESVNGHGLELWERAHFIARFHSLSSVDNPGNR